MAVLAPIPRARAARATAVNPGFFRIMRRAYRRSAARVSIPIRNGCQGVLVPDKWSTRTRHSGGCEKLAVNPPNANTVFRIASGVSVPELSLPCGGARALGVCLRNAGRGGGMAIVRADASAAGPGTGGAGAVFAGHAAVPGGRTYGRPLSPQEHSAVLHGRLRAGSPVAGGLHVERIPGRLSDLPGAAAERNR